MLKLKLNETLTWDIDWVNKTFTSDNYIALVDSITVDGVLLTPADYTINRYDIIFNTAPTTSIVPNFFIREELDIVGEGTVEFWDISREVYEELWRNNLSRVYDKTRVDRMIEKSLKRITNKTSEKWRVQHYALEWINWMKILQLSNNWFSGSHIQWIDTEWVLLAWDNVFVEYTDYDWSSFTTETWVDTVLNIGDKVLVSHRVPYWVQKITEVLVDGIPLTYIDNQMFSLDTDWFYTIMRGKNWSQYLFLPYSEKAYTLSVKYVPDRERISLETDIVDIPYEYTTVIVYDVLYRILLSREDDRMQGYKTLLYWDAQDPGLLKEYRRYVREMVKKSRGVIRNVVAVKPTYNYVRYKDKSYTW